MRSSEHPRRPTSLRKLATIALAALGVSVLAACSSTDAAETPVLPIITASSPTPQSTPAFFQSYGPEWSFPVEKPILTNDGISCKEAESLPPEKAGYVQEACDTIDNMMQLFEIDPLSRVGILLSQAAPGIHFLDPTEVRKICGADANACSIPGGGTNIIIDTTLPGRYEFRPILVQELIHNSIQNAPNVTYTSSEGITLDTCSGRITLTDSNGIAVGINEAPANLGATMYDYMENGVIDQTDISYVEGTDEQKVIDQAKNITHQNVAHPTETDLSLIVDPTKDLAAFVALFSNSSIPGSPMEQFHNFTSLFPAESPGCQY